MLWERSSFGIILTAGDNSFGMVHFGKPVKSEVGELRFAAEIPPQRTRPNFQREEVTSSCTVCISEACGKMVNLKAPTAKDSSTSEESRVEKKVIDRVVCAVGKVTKTEAIVTGPNPRPE